MLAVVAGILLLMLAVMFIMGRRAKSKGQRGSGRSAQSRPQTQTNSAVPPQLVVDEPKHPVQDPYGGNESLILI